MPQDARMESRSREADETGKSRVDTMELISVVVEGEAEEEEAAFRSRTLSGSPRGSGERNVKQLEVGRLRASFGKLSEQVSTILQDVQKVGDFQLKEVQLQVEVSSEGGVNLIGNLKAGAKGAITLKFSA